MTATDVRPWVDEVAVEEATRPRTAAVGRRRPRAEAVAVGLGLVLVAVVYSLNLAGWPRWFDDEGTYYAQAWAVQNLGALAPYTYWYDHPPIGWLQLAAFTWLPDLFVQGSSALLSGRIVMVGYMVVSAGLLYLLARRLGMAKGWSFTAMLLWALNPLVLFEGRQVFLDTVALPWLIGAFVLALNRRHHLGLHMASGLCFAIAVLSKETMLIFAPALVWAVWQSAYRPTRAFALVGFAALTAMTGAMYVLFALVRDELFPGPDHVSLWEALMFQFFEREGSGSIFDADGPEGGAHETFQSWLQLDPYLLVGGVVAGAVGLLLVRRLRPIGLAVLLAAMVGLRPDGYLPQMYVVAMLPFCALAVVGLLDELWRRADGLRGKAAAYGVGLVVLTSLAVGALPLQTWKQNYAVAWTADANDPHSAMQRRVAELPADVRIAVDNTYWNDLVVGQGRAREDVVWFFKVDTDGLVLEELGGDYLGLDYIVWTDYMSENAGPLMTQAFEQSTPLSTFGTGEDAVQLRRVPSRFEIAETRRAEAETVARRLEREQRTFDAFLARPSTAFPDLTNGQVDAIRVDQRTLTLGELARKYQTTERTVTAVLRTPVLRDRADAVRSGR